jgi:dTDP-4-amino-4,6-dideoxygalactose transaminase
MIPFSPPRIDDKIIAEVTDTLKSGWITTGPKTKRFEKELIKFSKAKSVLCTSAATTGLELILRWFDIGPGDEVIVPAYTYCATANVVMHCGATLILVDSLVDNFNIDPEKIRAAITPKTKVIIPVDIGGFPANYDEINAIIREENIVNKFNPSNEIQSKLGRILILADTAHSLGGYYKGQTVGSIADISVFSFHAVKNLTTAEGGAIALNLPTQFDNTEIYKELNIMSLHGQSKDALAKSQGANWKYDVLFPGYKANMTDIQASMGLVEIERYESDTLVKRKNIAESYQAAFKDEPWAQIPSLHKENSTTSYHLYQLRIKDISEEQRDAIIQEIFAQEVSVNVHFQPLPLFTAYKNAGYKMSDYPNAFDNYSREISLPVYYDLSDDNVVTVIKAVKKAVKTIIG